MMGGNQMSQNPEDQGVSPPWVVLKFGGTSVSSLACWETIASVAGNHLSEGRRPFVVCSALSGISNLLEKLTEEAVLGNHEEILQEVESRHLALAESLGVNGSEILASEFEELRRISLGASLTGEGTPRLHARLMSCGELMSTRLGAAWLNQMGVETHWLDARTALRAEEESDASSTRQYLSSPCDYSVDQGLQEELGALSASVVLTQGFIATNEAGETVLLGRGGSDTSAAYFAAKLQAERCEIWTDVPGMYSANPHQIPEARLLRHLDFEEAQEIASTGAKVLHPRCISPAREHLIPLYIRCTSQPDRPGTVVSADAPESSAQVKAISTKRDLTLISMDTVGMWQQVGFLADVFTVFKACGLSIDLVSTSETNVTVSLDPGSNALDREAVDRVVRELGNVCQARAIGPCASVSLVGKNIRGILHQLGPALALFEEQQIHLVSQAANDLNLTFVVDENQAERLVAKLHDLLFARHGGDAHLGPTWREDFAAQRSDTWWSKRVDELLDIASEGSPVYVYDEQTLDDSVAQLKAMGAVDQVYYSIKANSHPEILRRFFDAGLGMECVSPGEVERVLELFGDPVRERILFTPNFAPRSEYAEALEKGVRVTLDNLHPLQSWPDLFEGKDIFIRVDPGRGRGHHEYVRTAGAHSKFGVSPGEIPLLTSLVQECGANSNFLAAVFPFLILSPFWGQAALYIIS